MHEEESTVRSKLHTAPENLATKKSIEPAWQLLMMVLVCILFSPVSIVWVVSYCTCIEDRCHCIDYVLSTKTNDGGDAERRRGSMDRINQRHNLSNNEQNVLSCKNSALMLLPKCFTSRCVALDHVHEAVKCSSSAVYSDTNLRRPPPRLESIYHRHLAKLVPRC